MMTNSYRSIDALLSSAQLAIAAAQTNAEIQAALVLFGYPPEEIQRGRSLYETALSAQQQRHREYAEQIGASASLNDLRDALDNLYRRHLKLARIACKNDPVAISKLGLQGKRKRTFSGWLGHVQQFYTALSKEPANSSLLQELSRYSITPEAIEDAQTQIETVLAASVAREKEKGEAQQATQDRDAALDALQAWMSDLFAVAQIALEARPQLLEAMGRIVPS